jgi:hypothetical protein
MKIDSKKGDLRSREERRRGTSAVTKRNSYSITCLSLYTN